MKKSEIRAMILQEMDNTSYKRAAGLVKAKSEKAFLTSAKDMIADLVDDGYDNKDAVDYLITLLKKKN